MKIRFVKDFAGNWKAGDVVEAKILSDGDILVDNVARIDAALLLVKHCAVIIESEDNDKENEMK